MVDSDQAMSVGEVAERAGIAVSTLHFYERKGLIESWRNSGNQRRYSRSILRIIAVIRIAQQAGVPLSEIREHLSELPSGKLTAKQWEAMSAGWHDELDQRIKQLTDLRDRLHGCIGCGCLSTRECPLRNPDDELSSRGPGAHLL